MPKTFFFVSLEIDTKQVKTPSFFSNVCIEMFTWQEFPLSFDLDIEVNPLIRHALESITST